MFSGKHGKETGVPGTDEEMWLVALEMANSGEFSELRHLESALRGKGYSKEVNALRDTWKRDRLAQLCRDSSEGRNNA